MLQFLYISKKLKNTVCQYAYFATKAFVEQLSKRTLLTLTGPDTLTYLQSMITNDVKTIDNVPALYSLLLNARGKVLYDILLYKIGNDKYLVEYESTAVEYMHKHLFMYRLRRNVKIQPVNDLLAWVLYPIDINDDSCVTSLENFVGDVIKLKGVVTCVQDPRLKSLGVRVITEKNVNLAALLPQSSIKFAEGSSYRIYRYKLGVGEGVIDHPTGTCMPLETNMDFLNGVSFTKGCYMGQELVARSHYTLHIRKRLLPIVLKSLDLYPKFPPECCISSIEDNKIGRLRSHVGQYGLALLKYDDCFKADQLFLKDFNIQLKVVKPFWWPDDLTNKC